MTVYLPIACLMANFTWWRLAPRWRKVLHPFFYVEENVPVVTPPSPKPFRILISNRRVQAYEINERLRYIYSLFCISELIRLLTSFCFARFGRLDAPDRVSILFSVFAFSPIWIAFSLTPGLLLYRFASCPRRHSGAFSPILP